MDRTTAVRVALSVFVTASSVLAQTTSTTVSAPDLGAPLTLGHSISEIVRSSAPERSLGRRPLYASFRLGSGVGVELECVDNALTVALERPDDSMDVELLMPFSDPRQLTEIGDGRYLLAGFDPVRREGFLQAVVAKDDGVGLGLCVRLATYSDVPFDPRSLTVNADTAYVWNAADGRVYRFGAGRLLGPDGAKRAVLQLRLPVTGSFVVAEEIRDFGSSLAAKDYVLRSTEGSGFFLAPARRIHRGMPSFKVVSVGADRWKVDRVSFQGPPSFWALLEQAENCEERALDLFLDGSSRGLLESAVELYRQAAEVTAADQSYESLIVTQRLAVAVARASGRTDGLERAALLNRSARLAKFSPPEARRSLLFAALAYQQAGNYQAAWDMVLEGSKIRLDEAGPVAPLLQRVRELLGSDAVHDLETLDGTILSLVGEHKSGRL